ncbi:MAG: HAD-IA family hydrolase [Clostridia bacterium]|nr:HAD-IA family hydrolase [Clostridia bacterium]
MIKAIIFDLDGTLADTIGSIRRAVNLAMSHYGFAEHSYDAVRCAIGNGARMLIRRLIPAEVAADEARVDEILDYYNARYAETYRDANRCYDGMKHAVMTLHERGYRLAILSNKPDIFVRELAKILFPENIISIAQGQTDLPVKPDPSAPLDIAARLDVNPNECAFVGDSEVDIMTAKNAGMYSVGCSWGYRSRELLSDTGADIIIDTPPQILNTFK